MNRYVWGSVEELFHAMNQYGEYVVLRNYEQFPESLTLGGHEDIDLLCQEPQRMAKVMRAEPVKGSIVHHTIQINERVIPVDIRHVGDGYYDENWERSMLIRKKVFKGIYQILDQEDYYYSLMYHAVIQKPFVANDYFNRLKKLGEKIEQKNFNSKEELVITLIKYLRKHAYKVTNTEDPDVFLDFKYIPKDMIQRNIKWSFNKRFCRFVNVVRNKFRKIKTGILKLLSRGKRKIIRF